MNQTISLLTISLLLSACAKNRSTSFTQKADTLITEILVSEDEIVEQASGTKRLSFRSVSEIVADSSSSCWVQLQGDNASLALHFQYKDTLAVSYSSECWLMYPYKLEGNKIVVYWAMIIDTKYNFDIVKAIKKTGKKYVGQPFMILELENDTTFKATYPIKELIRIINSSSKDRVFFPEKYSIAQDGFL